MYTGIYHTHKLVVIIFLIIYLIKFILLLTNTQRLDGFSKKVKVFEMIISFLFLATGIYLATQTSEITTILMAKFGAVIVSIPLAIIGFKKHNKVLGVLAVLLLFTAYGLAEMNRGFKAKKTVALESYEVDMTAESYDAIEHGKAIYLSQCALCHGPSGDMGINGAKNLITSKLAVEDVLDVITNGKNAMPGYAKSFSKEEIEAIKSYVLTLRK